MRNSPVARTPPKNLPVIPGVTCDASPHKDKPKLPRSPVPPKEVEHVAALQIEKGMLFIKNLFLLVQFLLLRLILTVEEKKLEDEAQFDMDM